MARKAKRYKPGDMLVFKKRVKHWHRNREEYTVIVIVDANVDESLRSKPTRYRYLQIIRTDDGYVNRRQFKKINHSTLRTKMRNKHWGDEVPKLEYVVQFGGFTNVVKKALEGEKRRAEYHLAWYSNRAEECEKKLEILDRALSEYE